MNIRKADLIEIVGTHAALASKFGITRSAVSQWGEYIPALQVYRLRELDPELYAAAMARGRTEAVPAQ